MNKKSVLLIVFVFFAGRDTLFAQQTDKKLKAKLEEVVSGFKGDIGIYVKNLRTGKVVAINADSVFPTASIVKVPILLGIMDKIHRSELHYD
ncbi:MAG: serine hydrolase, partial [Chitinophagaceae bacterium]